MNAELSATLIGLHREVHGDARLLTQLEMAKRNNASFVCASGNAGDGLVHLGAFSILRRLGWSPRIISESALADEADGSWAVMVGGAIIEGVCDERLRSIRGFLDRGGRLILLPCTLIGYRDFLRQYGAQLTVFAREKRTFENVRAAGVANVSLCHDLAFAVDPAFYLEIASSLRQGELFVFSGDEARSQARPPFRNVDLGLLWNGDIWDNPHQVEERCRLLGRTLATFEAIETDRLQIGLFAAVSGCRVRLFAAPEGTVPGVFEHSLSRFSRVELVRADDEPPDAASGATKLRIEYCETEIARLKHVVAEQDKRRGEWFEPELERRRLLIEEMEYQAVELRKSIAMMHRQSLQCANELNTHSARERQLQEQLDSLRQAFDQSEAKLILALKRPLRVSVYLIERELGKTLCTLGFRWLGSKLWNRAEARREMIS